MKYALMILLLLFSVTAQAQWIGGDGERFISDCPGCTFDNEAIEQQFREHVSAFCAANEYSPACQNGTREGFSIDTSHSGYYGVEYYIRRDGTLGSSSLTHGWPKPIYSMNCAFFQVCHLGSLATP